MEQHPNYVKQKQEIADRRMARIHMEALAEHVRREVMALVASYDFDIEVDRWGTEQTMLRHRTERGYDYEIPLGESE